MSDPSIRRLHLRPAAIAILAALLTACAGAPGDSGAGALATADTGAAAGGDVENLMVVDCLLPGQIRRLGLSTTYLSARRHTKTTRSDCEIRGGEYVLFDRSDYGSALKTLLPKAQAGDPVAQAYVGEIYEKGLGLPGPDYAQAAVWYRKAADSGYAPAQTSLGSLYERGLGVPQDKRQALDLYRQASGLSEDRLVFESQLEQERAAFQKEIALRNRVASSLRAQLATTKSQLKSATGAKRTALERTYQEQQRVMESEQRAAASRAEQSQRELEAARALKAQEQQGGGKSAQAGKLELVRADEYRTALDTSNRLAGPP